MTADQEELLQEARMSLAAAGVLRDNGFHGFATSRAYYAMFYAAEAMRMSRSQLNRE